MNKTPIYITWIRLSRGYDVCCGQKSDNQKHNDLLCEINKEDAKIKSQKMLASKLSSCYKCRKET